MGIIKSGVLIAECSIKELLHSDDEVVEIITPQIEQAAGVLKTVNYVQSICISAKGITVQMDRGSSSKLNMLLVSNNISVESIVPKANSLEKLYFEKVGNEV